MPSQGSSFSVRTVAALASIGVMTLGLSSAAIGQQKTLPVFVNGQAQVVPGFEDSTQWIRQELWVETESDADGDGKRDRVHVDVVRPRQTETEGLKVPVIYESSPYYSREYSGRPKIELWDVKQEVDTFPPPRTIFPTEFSKNSGSVVSMSHVETWVPRGFAVVHSESPGTGLSQGCPTIGGENESLAPKAVVDWLNGRARGFTTVDGNEQVQASWATGKVGMIGGSYNGTLALAAATTGVEGLTAVVPIAPVSSWYEYYRSNGLVRHPAGYLGEDIDVIFDALNTGFRGDYCVTEVRERVLVPGHDRVKGDSNAFWAARDYLGKVNNIRAAVLIGHAFNDWNVMPDQTLRIYEALRKRHAPVQAYYDQGGHGGEPPLEQLNRWFTRYVYGVENGVEKDSLVWIVREGAADENPTPYPDYPNPGSAPVTLYPQAGGSGIGGLSLAKRGGQGKETLTDDVALGAGALAQAERDTHRLLYATPVLTEAVHLSGWSTITMQLASSKPAANLSVYLVALPATRDSGAKLITRGWADPQNYKSLTKGEPLVPGRLYPLSFKLQPEDRVIPAGMRLGLMIFSSDRNFTLWPRPGTELTLDVDATSIVLPIVGGPAALKRAFGEH
jgi:X-Pro dipeptidyl-peptidase